MIVGGVDVGPGVSVGGRGVGDSVAVKVGDAVNVGLGVAVGLGVRVGVAVGGRTGVAVRKASTG
jgi:hypothetical protein